MLRINLHSTGISGYFPCVRDRPPKLLRVCLLSNRKQVGARRGHRVRERPRRGNDISRRTPRGARAAATGETDFNVVSVVNESKKVMVGSSPSAPAAPEIRTVSNLSQAPTPAPAVQPPVVIPTSDYNATPFLNPGIQGRK